MDPTVEILRLDRIAEASDGSLLQNADVEIKWPIGDTGVMNVVLVQISVPYDPDQPVGALRQAALRRAAEALTEAPAFVAARRE